ncbi:beta-N-acetylhexosaminidase [Thalassotalea ponticola]|uniref:beta-N-acetylhexosaminidase n=1 Tax=Thalassotalea ponticola TaxID=1523392 RepID=UPI0025B5368D|nr:beta-N-acetylhexosaminidase [Thalassotalea ponticola]MDN3651273.1 beta-N-acetylhexosaminidase [Thalassotalea ponticola]
MALLMIDVQSTELNREDEALLAHPKVGGLILFSRNYDNVEQLTRLCQQVKQINPKCLIAVDQEGGRVQRFRHGFSALPPMGKIYAHAVSTAGSEQEVMERARQNSQAFGYLMASEVRASGVDISLAPVLDLDGISEVIGDRGFHHLPQMVSCLSSAFISGMQQAGMKATGKHFPGHGSVQEDSHIAMPVDFRSKQQIFDHDLTVFSQLIANRQLDAIMPAHVIYPAVDDKPVGFSALWLQTILRQQLGFDGVIFSDDLSMQGASVAGSVVERCQAAAQAGCDMLLVCNDRQGAVEAIDRADIDAQNNIAQQRIQTMLATVQHRWHALGEDALYVASVAQLNRFNQC